MKPTGNLHVVRAWRDGQDARNHKNTLKSVGGDLLSYDLKIGARSLAGTCVVANYTSQTKSFCSHATSRHVNLAAQYAHMVMHPKVSELSPLFKTEELPF
jgi:hypothetical protein